MLCKSCKQNVEEIKQAHDKNGHNIEHFMRGEVGDDSICEDCVDDILENIYYI